MEDRAYYPGRGRYVYTFSSSECRTNGPRRSVVYGPEYLAGECRDDEQKFIGGFPSVTPTNYRYPSYREDIYRRPSNPCDDIDQLAREVDRLFTSVQNQPSRPVFQYTTSTPSNIILVSMLRPPTHSVSAAPAPDHEGAKDDDDDEDPNNSEYSSTDEDDDDGDDKKRVSSKPDPKDVGFKQTFGNRLSNDHAFFKVVKPPLVQVSYSPIQAYGNRLSNDPSRAMPRAPLRNQKPTANSSLENMKTGPATATARGKQRQEVLRNPRVPAKTRTR